MRNKSLGFKINAAIFITCLVIALIFGAILYPFELERRKSHETKVSLLLDTIFQQKYEDLANEIYAGQTRALNLTLKDILKVEGIAAISVYAPDGRLIRSTNDSISGSLTDPETIISPGMNYFEIHSYKGRSLGIYSREIEVIGEVIAVLKIYYDFEGLNKETRLAVLIFLTLLLTTVILMSVLLNLMLSRFVTRPVLLLRNALNKIQKGILGETVNLPFRDEIGKMGIAFNEMSEELHENQVKIKKAEEKYRSIFEKATIGIYQTTSDDKGHFLTVNPAFAKILNYSSPEDVMENVTDIQSQIYVAPEDRKKLQLFLKKQGYVKGFETKFYRKDGSIIDVAMNVHVIYDENKNMRRYEGILEDITEKKHAERLKIEKEAAEAATRAKSDFLANMSHEIRTPMNAVLGTTYLALKTELTPKQQDYLKRIEVSAKSLLGVINDILDFSKIESGRMDIEQAEFDLTQTLDHVINIIMTKTRKKENLEVLFHIDPDVPLFLIGDSLRLGQVLVNLCDNAIKFTEEGEIILTVSIARKSGDEITLSFSVRDTGIGISSEQRKRLFEPFTQADTSTTRKFGGTGLGLVICRRLIEMMGGTIRVKSELGKGADFLFTAVFKKSEKQPTRILHPPVDLIGLKVLVVDDNASSRHILKSILGAFRFKITLAESGEQGFKALENAMQDRPYELIVMDGELPGIGRMGPVEKIVHHPRFSTIPKVIMATAFHQESVLQQMDPEGTARLLLKPFSPSSLFDAIMQTLNLYPPELSGQAVPNEELLKKLKTVQGARILVVEDNRINQMLAREILEEAGFIVTIADDGRKAVEMVAGYLFDAVLMDIQMPIMDGYQATKQIRKKLGREHLPIIAMTAHAMAGDRAKSLEAGMMEHITKPVDPEELFSALLAWINPENITPSEPMAVKKKTESKRKIPPSFRDMPGINTQEGLSRSLGKEDFYRKILIQFHGDYSDISDSLQKAVEMKQEKTILGMVHTIKGLAGSIGAAELSYAARDLETHIKSGKDSEIRTFLERFNTALMTVIESIETFVIPAVCPVPEADVKETGEQSILPALLLKLEPCVLNREPKPCLEIMDEIMKFSWPEENKKDLCELHEFIRGYQFKKAQSLMADMIENLKG